MHVQHESSTSLPTTEAGDDDMMSFMFTMEAVEERNDDGNSHTHAQTRPTEEVPRERHASLLNSYVRCSLLALSVSMRQLFTQDMYIDQSGLHQQ